MHYNTGMLEEYWSDTSKHLQRYREKKARYQNKRTSPHSFTPGTLVLCNTCEVEADLPQLKFTPSWEDPYVIFEDVRNGCYDLKMVDEDDIFRVNAKILKL